MTNNELKKILEQHRQWLNGNGGSRVDLCGADLSGTDLNYANLNYANLSYANLSYADLRGANLCGANLRHANLSGADLRRANLRDANLIDANLRCADLCGADLSDTDLNGADLSGTKNMVKVVGVFLGNRYYKAISENLCNNGYTYTVGLNTLREGEVFASDDRVLCSFPGFHFASESWCRTYYGDRQYLCLIRIPTKEEYEQIEINEPWATDGKASASAIIIEKVFDIKDGDKDVTDRFIGWADGKGNKT
jgi:hypothetical protein